MNKECLYIRSIHISNFKPFKAMFPPLKLDLADNNGELIEFLMLSGFNGYGKTTIFQAIEFALNGKIEIFQFKDTTKKYSEHISINEIGIESLIAIELSDSEMNNRVSIIRYNEKTSPCKESECLEEFHGYNLYIDEGIFDYDTFKSKLESKEIIPVTTDKIAEIINETNVSEWLSSNYLKQEQTSNILFKSNKERVNYVNQYISQEGSEYFQKIYDEKDRLTVEYKALYEDVLEQKSKLKQVEINSIGEKPQSIRVFLDKELFWDKLDYSDDEDFSTFLVVINAFIRIMDNKNIYTAHDKKIALEKISKDNNTLRQVVIFNFFKNNLTEYIELYNRKKYLESLLLNKEQILKNELSSQYLNLDIILNIESYRNKTTALNNALNEKQKIYSLISNTRDIVIKNLNIVSEVFDDVCPLCGCSYREADKSLSASIDLHQEMFKQLSTLIDENASLQIKNINIEFNTINEKLKNEINSIKVDESLYSDLLKIIEKLDMFSDLKNRLEYILDFSFDDYDELEFTKESIGSMESIIIEKLQSLYLELSNISNLNDMSEDDVNFCIKYKNEIMLVNEYNFDIKESLNIKENLIKWHMAKQNYDKFTKDVNGYREVIYKVIELKKRLKKLEVITSVIESAKNTYLNTLISYIEIPLYIYSGKLMQTHQNGLGIFCTTGKSDEKVTQFKLTTKGDNSGHDIVNKFSSGQKSVMNVATMIAFRKIRSSKFNLFMIDDPCQSMDDINTASLTEILRNEFSDSQVIISTHSEVTANYMCYKYSKAGKRFRNINVQKEFYTIEKEARVAKI